MEQEIRYNNNYQFGNSFKGRNINNNNNNNNNNIDANSVNGNNLNYNQDRNNNHNNLNNLNNLNNNNHHQNKYHQAQPQAAPIPMNNAQAALNDIDEQKKENIRSAEEHELYQTHLREIAKWFLMFKIKPCGKGLSCPQGINCMEWHGVHDKRRVLMQDEGYAYKPEACPHLFDFWKTKKFYHNYKCPDGGQCKYAHNYYELGYHRKTYKTVRCPYLDLARNCPHYKTKQCPFDRKKEWFYSHFGQDQIKKIKGNIVMHRDGTKMCLDFCPFYHGHHDRRYHLEDYQDADITYHKKEKAASQSPPKEANK